MNELTPQELQQVLVFMENGARTLTADAMRQDNGMVQVQQISTLYNSLKEKVGAGLVPEQPPEENTETVEG
jgi:hypothetical protein